MSCLRYVTSLGILVLLSPGLSGQAASQQDEAGIRLSDFKIIQEKNIFNPNRHARSSGERQRSQSTRTIRSENFALTGVISYEKGTFAFFDGSSSSYRKVLKKGEAIAEFEVAELGPEHVRLVSGTNDLKLEVGYQMRKEQGGQWRLAGRAEYGSTPSMIQPAVTAPAPTLPSNSVQPQSLNDSPPEPPMAFGMEPPEVPPFEGPPLAPQFGEGAPPASDAPPASADNESPDEVLRRLAERREQEMNR